MSRMPSNAARCRARHAIRQIVRPYAVANGLNLKTLAARAGEPQARVKDYGTRYESDRVAWVVAGYVQDAQRQMRLPL